MKDTHKRKKRFLALLLAAAMIVTYMPSFMFAYADADNGELVSSQESEQAEQTTEADVSEGVEQNAGAGSKDLNQGEAAPEDQAAEEGVTENSGDEEEEQAPAAEEVTDAEKGDSKTISTSGDDYKIAVTYDSSAEIPDGAKLQAKEIDQDSSEYQDYYEQTAEALDSKAGLSFARFFDVRIMYNGEEVQPAAEVTTRITYKESTATVDNQEMVGVHFPDDGKVEILEADENKASTVVEFEQDGFSVTGTARSAVGAGDYIIYRESGSHALTWNLGSQSVTISGNQVTSTNDSVVWTFEQHDNGYRISYTQGGSKHYLRATNNNDLQTTTNAGNATTWTYDNSHLHSGNHYLRYSDRDGFVLGGNNTDHRTIYLAEVVTPVTITVNYVDESGTPLKDPETLQNSTSTGVTAIEDIVDKIDGKTYHNTYLTSTSGTQIVPELRGASGGTWEYQVYGQQNYTRFTEDTDIYVVYGDAYGSDDSGSGGGGGGDEPEVPVPTTVKDVADNGDGTYNLSLSITGRSSSSDSSKGANVILVLDTSNSMNDNRVPGGSQTRLQAAKEAAQNVSTTLLGLNTEKNPNLVEMCLVTFNWDISTSSWYSNATGFNGIINAAGHNSGTNWEGALQGAINAANGHKDGDDTYIIFLTDGNPSSYTGSSARYDNEANNNTNSPYYYRISPNYMHATDEARQIVQNGWNFYSIGMYGNVDVLKYLTNFAYTGRSNGTETESGHYFPAAQTSELVAALKNIAEIIEHSLSLAGVSFDDGITNDVTHTALSTDTGGKVRGITYSKTGGSTEDYTVTVDHSGNVTFKVGDSTAPGSETTITYKKINGAGEESEVTEDATASVYSATIGGKTYYMPKVTLSESGDLDWDLAPLGTLEGGATYKIEFTVWPDQEAYDTVADLNNGLGTWNSATQVPKYAEDGETVLYYTNGVDRYPNIVKYTNGTYAALTNSHQSVDYYVQNKTESGDESSTTYIDGEPINLPFPDPMVLTGSTIQLEKKWDDTLQPGHRTGIESVDLILTKDGVKYGDTITLSEANGWKQDGFSIAPGIMVTKDSDAYEYATTYIEDGKYGILEPGHDYIFTEPGIDYHYELTAYTYHPMLIDGELKNVTFIRNDEGEITGVKEIADMTYIGATNTLRGGINVSKVVKDPADTDISSERTDDVFDMDMVLEAPKDADGNYDMSHLEDFTEGETVVKPTVAWYRYIDSEGNTVTDPSKLEFAGSEHREAEGSTWFYLDFVDDKDSSDYGKASGTIKVTTEYSVRFVNIAAGVTYTLSEDTAALPAGYDADAVTYEFTHVTKDAEGKEEKTTDGPDDAHVVAGNAENNIAVTNKLDTYGDITVNKVWDDDNNHDRVRPDSVTFKLYKTVDGQESAATDAQGDELDAVVLNAANKKEDNDNEWTYTFTDLPLYEGSKAITYSVKEMNGSTAIAADGKLPGKAVSGLTPSESEYTVTYSDDKLTVTNKHTPVKRTINGTKTWNVGNGTVPDTITIILTTLVGTTKTTVEYVVGLEGTEGINITAVPDGTNTKKWNFTIDGLDAVVDGVVAAYSIAEKEMEGYLTTQTGNDIVNTKLISVPVAKIWNDADDQDGNRPEAVTLQLYKKSKGSSASPTEVSGKSIRLDASKADSADANKWTGEFTGLEAYDAEGNEIVYSIVEEQVTDGKLPGKKTGAKYAYSVSYSDDNLTVTNSYTPEPTQISITKKWEDAGDQDGKRLTAEQFAAKVHLMNGDTEVTGYIPTVTDNGNNTYTVTYSGMPKYSAGQEIVYTVKEDSIPGYTADKTTAANGETITNTHVTEKTDVSVTKVWVDSNNKSTARPDSVTFQLYKKAEGSEGDPQAVAKKLTLTATDAKVTDEDAGTKDENTWTGTFSNLPKYEGGKELTYTIKEMTGSAATDTAIEDGGTLNGKKVGYDYKVSYSEDSLTVTNTLETVDLKITKDLINYVDHNSSVGGNVTTTFVFEITGTKEGETTPAYKTQVGIQLDKAGTASKTLQNLPKGLTYKVTEVYSGSYTASPSSKTLGEADLTKEGDKYIYKVTFENSGKKIEYGGGVINTYDGKNDMKQDGNLHKGAN